MKDKPCKDCDKGSFYYALYHSKKEGKLKIIKMGTKTVNYDKAVNLCEDVNKVYRFNVFYMFSMSRKSLRERALEIKDGWVVDAQLELDRLKEIKIK